MQFIYSLEVFFNITLEKKQCFIPPLHEFKLLSFAVKKNPPGAPKAAIFCAVPMNSNATGISRNVTSLVFQNQLHYSCCVHNHPWRVGPTGAITNMYVGSDILEFSAPFFDRCTLTTPSPYTVLRISSDFLWRKHVWPVYTK